MCLSFTGVSTSLTPASAQGLLAWLCPHRSQRLHLGPEEKAQEPLPVSRSLIPQLCTNGKQAPGEGGDVSAASVFRASLLLLRTAPQTEADLHQDVHSIQPWPGKHSTHLVKGRDQTQKPTQARPVRAILEFLLELY